MPPQQPQQQPQQAQPQQPLQWQHAAGGPTGPSSAGPWAPPTWNGGAGYPPPPPYGPYGSYGHNAPYAPAPSPRRRRALPTALAAMVAALVAAAAILLHGGTAGTVAGGALGSLGDPATGTPTATTSTDYDSGVVNIDAVLGSQNAMAAGTGMILSADGTVLTNNHVVEGATSVTATDVNTGKQYAATIVGTDANDDIAVLKLRNASGLTPVVTGDSSAVAVGQKVVAIGNAGGRGGTPSVVTGSVTALGQTITATDANGSNAETLSGLIQVNAPIVAGDSGGPLTDSSGKVIGIDTAASASQTAGRFGPGGFGSGTTGSTSTQTSAGFAIPIAHALAVAKTIEAGGGDSGSSSSSSSSNHGYLGVSVSDDASGAGAAIAGTVVGSPAESAGLTAGSVITRVNGTTITSASALSEALANSAAGQQVTVTWTDSAGASHTATITLMNASA